MKYSNLILLLILFYNCESPKVFDSESLEKAIQNADLSQESFVRSINFTNAWLQKADPESGLIPSNLQSRSDLWDPANAAADNYPYMVLSAYLLDTDLFKGQLLEILHQEKKLSSRWNSLPDEYSFTKKDFVKYPLNRGNVIFGASEYIKDGLIPLNELIGKSPWQDRMMEMLDELHLQMEDFKDLEKYFKRAASVEEINGEMLQTLSRVYWMTGDDKYLNWAISIADHYLIEKDLSQIEYLRLRDHGCEIIGGLSELFLTLHLLSHPKVDVYRPPLYRLLDRILVFGRNTDGLFYNAINLKTKEVIDQKIADTWGYILNAYYTVWMVDQKIEYIEAVRKPFKPLNRNYRSYNWEPRKDLEPLGSHDGYADAIESGINLYNREKDIDLKNWIDSEIQRMFEMQKANGIIEGWHGDGNFARTALMYGLWKTQGAHLSPWNKNLSLGAVADQKGTYFVVIAKNDWEGQLIFDKIRHKTIWNLPVDYPRINQFPEWFTIDPELTYKLTASEQRHSGTYSGKNLLEGIDLKLSAGQTLKILIE